MRKTFFIFRHGETDWNRELRIQGQSDIPLNATGRKQAEGLREFFKQEPVDIFLSSDLIRAHETAKIANQLLGAPIQIDARLRETHLGVAEGLTREQIAQKLGDEIWHRWTDSIGPKNSDHRFPGGESKREHLNRVFAAIESFAKVTPHTRIGISTHGGALRRLIHHLLPDLTEHAMVPNCAVYRAEYDTDTQSWYLQKEPVFLPERE